MNGKQAVEYIHSVSWLGSRPGLERISELSEKMGDPAKNFRVIHVAGTNGKGSFCSMTASILTKCGYKVGLFTSPYVRYFNERIQINGEMISDNALGEITEYVKSFADKMDDTPTEFELLTAIAFEYFARQRCDLVVLEAGLGGRLDSTNIVENPVLSVITGISLDHTAILGDTEEKIAAEKAGIIKHGRPVLVGGMSHGARNVIAARAAELSSDVYFADYTKLSDARFSLDKTEFSYKGKEYHLSLLGEYQTRNAALVLNAIEVLRNIGVEIPDSAVKEGLATAKWPARFEVISKSPVAIYDGAHNPEGIEAAVRNYKLIFGDILPIVLTGVMRDKDHRVMTELLAKLALEVHTVTPQNPRAMNADELSAEFISLGAAAYAHTELGDGVKAVMKIAEEKNLPILILGSLYMYGEVMEAIESILYERN